MYCAYLYVCIVNFTVLYVYKNPECRDQIFLISHTLSADFYPHLILQITDTTHEVLILYTYIEVLDSHWVLVSIYHHRGLRGHPHSHTIRDELQVERDEPGEQAGGARRTGSWSPCRRSCSRRSRGRAFTRHSTRSASSPTSSVLQSARTFFRTSYLVYISTLLLLK